MATELIVGIDLGSQWHQLCVVDAGGQVICERRFEHTGAAIGAMLSELAALAASHEASVAIAVETAWNAVVEMAMERGHAVFTLNPKQLDRFRDRHTVAGAKDDRRDAYVLADSLRTDRHLFRPLRALPETIVQLRQLGRLHDELTGDAHALANRLDDELVRTFPELRKLGSVHADAWMLALLEKAPTAARAKHLPRATVRRILDDAGVRRLDAKDVIAALRAPPVNVAPGVADASARHVESLLPRLMLVRAQLRACDRETKALLDELSAEGDAGKAEHRDAAILRSLPGVGTNVSATMLGEAWEPLVDRDRKRLRSTMGVCPVARRSGKSSQVVMRRACNPRLRQAAFHWARTSLQSDARCKAHYARLRAKGHSHGRALRGVADRLLDLLMALLRGRQLYDPTRRAISV